jgi:hypothetical protein
MNITCLCVAKWELPSEVDLQLNSRNWFSSIIEVALPRMIDSILLVTWRIWYAHNEVTNAKPLPPVDTSKRFLSSYINTLRNIKSVSMEEIIKGK